MKNLKMADWISAALCLCAVIPGAAVYSRLPDRIATNWGLDSEVNGTMPKAVAVFAMPVLFTLLTLLCCAFAEKKKNGMLAVILRIMFPSLLFLAQGTILLFALGKMHDVLSVTCVFMSAAMILLGNYLPKVRKNWLIGIRTYATLKSEAVWHRTHRLAGFTVTAGGIAGLIAALCGKFVVTFVFMTVSLLIPLLYAEVIYRCGRQDHAE